MNEQGSVTTAQARDAHVRRTLKVGSRREERHEEEASVGDWDSLGALAEKEEALAEETLLTAEQGHVESRLHTTAVSLACILGWYLFSVSISVYNKWMFSAEHLDFRFPVFSTFVHQAVQTALAAGLVWAKPQWRPRTQLRSMGEYIDKIGPCAVASACDIGMGNVSLRWVTLSFYTMVKSSNLIFVMGFGVLFGLETPTKRMYVIVGAMATGVFMMVAGETQFQLGGFVLVLGAASASGLRWSLTRLLLHPQVRSKSDDSGHNPVSTILLVSPITGTILVVLALILEGPSQLANAQLWQQQGVIGGLVLMIFPGLLAFCMTLCEFLLLDRTGVLTLAIAGICKEVVTITLACVFFGDVLTLVNGLGLVLTTACVGAYNLHRYREAQAHAAFAVD